MIEESSSRAFTRSPFVWLAAAFAVGIVGAAVLPLPAWVALPACIAAAGGASIFGRSSGILVLLAFVAAGAVAYDLDTPAPSRIRSMIDAGAFSSDEPLEIEGTLVAEPEETVGGRSLEIGVESVVVRSSKRETSGRVRLFAPAPEGEAAADYGALNLGYGDRLTVTCRLDRDETFRNPGTTSRLTQLDAQGIDVGGIVKSPLLIRKIGAGSGPLRTLFRWRQTLIGSVRETFGVSTAGVLIASLLGNKQFLDRPTAELFRDGGTFHVLVISGLHITFIGGLLVAALQALRQSRLRQLLIAEPLIWAYAVAVGAEVPVVRAALMFSVVMIARALYRDGNLPNLFGLCAFGMLVWRPNDIFSPSFQLTFVSVGAIVGAAFPLLEKLRAIGEWRPTSESPFPPSAPRILVRFCERIYWSERTWAIESARNVWTARLVKSGAAPGFAPNFVRYLFEGVAVSVIVQIALMPLSVWYFNRVAFGSLALNLWVGCFLALESFAAAAALLVAQFSVYAAAPLVLLTDSLNWLLMLAPRIVSFFEVGGYRTPVYAGAGAAIYFIYFVPWVLIARSLNRWSPFALVPERTSGFRRTLPGALILTLIVLLHPLSSPRADGKLRIDFLDVGQGDSALVTFPNGETLLIDGGGRPNYQRMTSGRDAADSEQFDPDRPTIGEMVVSRFLWHRGLSEVDYLVATHADADHIQGLADVARNFKVRRAFFGRSADGDDDFEALRTVLAARKIPFSKMSVGDVLEIGGARVEILHPSRSESGAAGNDESVVIRIVFGERAFLFTGDIEAGAERFLAAGGFDLGSDVVKVAHHGSRTSSTAEFVAATNPRFAVISVGRESPFGHPHPEVIDRWRASGALLVTTGNSGTVTFATDGRTLEFDSFVK